MINNLFIENFRCINKLRVDNMKRITLFSGRNNVGKSTILEALFLMMDHTAADSFIKLNGFRGSSLTGINSLWNPLFHNLDTDKTIKITIAEKDVKSKLLIQKDQNYIPVNVAGFSEEILAQFRTATKSNFSLGFHFTSKDYLEEGHFSVNGPSIMRQIKTSLEGNEIIPMKHTRYLNNTYARVAESALTGIAKLELEGKKKSIIDIIKDLDPSIDDILTLSLDGVTQLYVRTKKKMIPLQYAGDGILRLLNICLALIEKKNSLVLIDEIETGLHYSMYKKLWSIIDRLSSDTECQIIATTHSNEIITAIKDGICKTKDFSYYRIGKSANRLTSSRYDYPMLSDALTFEMEIR